MALVFGTIAKAVNKKASGYGILLTTAARDGGLREDSLGLLACLVHSRTSQKYDKKILAAGWNDALKEALINEKLHFEKIKEAENKVSNLLYSSTEWESAVGELEKLLDSTPPQYQMVWDNLNLSTKHRFERAEDKKSTFRLDWMASLWIRDRISANHMDNTRGTSVKHVDDLAIKDMIPSEEEKDYVFINLVSYFSYRLIQRHPQIYKSIASSIRPNKPHQFQSAMNRRSSEMTGRIDQYELFEYKIL